MIRKASMTLASCTFPPAVFWLATADKTFGFGGATGAEFAWRCSAEEVADDDADLVAETEFEGSRVSAAMVEIYNDQRS